MHGGGGLFATDVIVVFNNLSEEDEQDVQQFKENDEYDVTAAPPAACAINAPAPAPAAKNGEDALRTLPQPKDPDIQWQNLRKISLNFQSQGVLTMVAVRTAAAAPTN